MSKDPASLQNLQDIVLPHPVSIWPPDTGGLLILAGLVLCMLVIGLQYYLKYRKNRYRRAGLALLESAASIRDVSVALKRVALAAFPREQVASLYGGEWIDFLNRTGARADFDRNSFTQPEKAPDTALLGSARKWISTHAITGTESLSH